jgi:hypothetical protein
METIANDQPDLADKQVYYGIMNHSASFKTAKRRRAWRDGSFDNRENLFEVLRSRQKNNLSTTVA